MLTDLIVESTPEVIQVSSINRLQHLYGSKDDFAVWEFVASHPFLISILEEVRQRVSDFFPLPFNLILEVTTDPEATASHALFVFIQTPLALTEALRRLDRFDEEWWLEASERAEGKLCIDVESL